MEIIWKKYKMLNNAVDLPETEELWDIATRTSNYYTSSKRGFSKPKIFEHEQKISDRRRHKVIFCELCGRVTCHTSLNFKRYRCNNCTRGFCDVPVIVFDGS